MVMHTLKALADLRGMPVAEMAAITNRNFFRLFDKVPVPPAYAASAA
jgi:Tat protein secretion system quality control protein TatD with DNase activity